MRDNPGDELPGEGRGGLIAFVLGQVALEDRVGRPLAELRLEDRREGKATAGPVGPDLVRGTLA